MQRLLAHEGACNSESSEEDEQDGESSSSSSENRKPSDPVPTDGPSGSGLPCGSGSRAPTQEPCGPGGSRDSDDSEESGGRRCSRGHGDPSRSAPQDERLPSKPHKLRKAGRCSASLPTCRTHERRVPDPAQVNPHMHTPARVSAKRPRQRQRREKRSRSTSPAGRKAHSRRRRPSAEHQGGHPSLTSVTAKAPPFFPRSRPRDADDSHHRRRGVKRRRVHHTDSSSRRSSCSSSSSSDSSSSSRHHHRCRRSSSLESFSDSPFISCSATPAKYLVKRIRQGKFVGLDKLLLPVLDELLAVGQAAGQAAKHIRDSRATRRHVVDLATRLGAWNIFFAVCLQVSPSSALQLAKYQTIMCQLFSSYPVGVCIKYDDSLFRQAAARDKFHLTPWDQVKDDILLWCATRHPFRAPKQPYASAQPPTAQTRLPEGAPPTHCQVRKFNYSSCTRADCSFAHKCWLTGCLGDHPGKSCPRATRLTFLGITLDSSTHQLYLPLDKQVDILHCIRGWGGRHKATKRELLSLIGKLSFAAKVVPAGRLFLRRLIDLSTTAKKLHHHIRITADAREDLAWWERFLPNLFPP